MHECFYLLSPSVTLIFIPSTTLWPDSIPVIITSFKYTTMALYYSGSRTASDIFNQSKSWTRHGQNTNEVLLCMCVQKRGLIWTLLVEI